MKKKYWIIICSIAGTILALTIFLICFFNIPRVIYGYDHEADTYFVDYVYGNASSYTIKDTIHDKPVTKIKARAFMKKSNLKEVTLGTNIIEIERLAFLDCKKLKNINLDNVKVIGRNAFENCISLEEIHLSAEDILGGAFIGCNNLSLVELKDVYSIGSYAFANTSIKEIKIPSSCSLVGEEVFYGCESLNKIIVYSYYLLNNSYLNSLNGIEFILN
ncbi:MAG: leucine-rich repeat domain-containing protein [Anaeroplasmataceae bacterium]|nr:leucine-rich repeat domain-containing protein [Anaeroplasmataceae bacterium]